MRCEINSYMRNPSDMFIFRIIKEFRDCQQARKRDQATSPLPRRGNRSRLPLLPQAASPASTVQSRPVEELGARPRTSAGSSSSSGLGSTSSPTDLNNTCKEDLYFCACLQHRRKRSFLGIGEPGDRGARVIWEDESLSSDEPW